MTCNRSWIIGIHTILISILKHKHRLGDNSNINQATLCTVQLTSRYYYYMTFACGRHGIHRKHYYSPCLPFFYHICTPMIKVLDETLMWETSPVVFTHSIHKACHVGLTTGIDTKRREVGMVLENGISPCFPSPKG